MNINTSFSAFFSSVQETPWYSAFLWPIVPLISPQSNVLDVGTGSGKLLQLLVNEKSAVCTGIDVSASMLDQAKRKLDGLPVELIHVKPSKDFPFKNNCFDAICFCNVLFNVSTKDQIFLMNQSLTVLNKGGTILVLTPTGKGSIKDFMRTVSKKNNKSFALWYTLTRRSARRWNKQLMLKSYADQNSLSYTNSLIFNDFGLLEIIKWK